MWILAAALILAPSVAQAQVWWDFIESLSGPGPFQGFGGYWRVACSKANTFRAAWDVDWTCWNDSSSEIRHIVEVRGLFPASDDSRARLVVSPADTRQVRASKVDAVASIRVLPSLDIGAGGGFIRFTGEDVNDDLRATIIPLSLTYTPLALMGSTKGTGRLLRIRLETMYIPFGFTGADWGQPGLSQSLYATDGNWVLTGGLLIDLGAFMKPEW
jgi:hypothetical protein